MPKIKYILFDCDNTLVLSEVGSHIAFRGCAELTNEVLASHNVAKRYTGEELMSTFVGMNFRGMLGKVMQIYHITLSPVELDEYVERELQVVTRLLVEEAQECPGATKELQRLHAENKYGLAVVSSSALSRVQASLHKTGQDSYIDSDKVFSAATSLPVPTSKPDPAIYLYACKQLGVMPSECLAVEDSRSGATSAMRAGCVVLGYVGAYGDEERVIMAKTLRSECGAIAIMQHWSDFQTHLNTAESGSLYDQ